MPAAVERQVIRAGEAAVTVCTLEWLHSRVLAVMPRQFIGSSKLPGAAFPGTFVGFFSCVRSPVSLQVGAFCVHFVASLKVTPMDAPLPGVWRLRPPLTPCALNTEW